MAKRRVHQVLTGLTYGDAISHHALKLEEILTSFQVESYLYSQFIGTPFLSRACELEALKKNVRPDDIIIFHYSIHSEASKTVQNFDNPIILIYHNITPPEYFSPYSSRYAALLSEGRRQLSSFRDRTLLALADSEFNRQDLLAAGYEDAIVFPIIFDETLYQKKANPVVSKIFNDGYINILSVGRIVPQKKIEDLITMFAWYRRTINNKSRLILVGEHRGFEPYFYGVMSLVEKLRLGEVHFMGLVPFDELIAYYSTADVLLSASEHEGFCVPLLEANYFSLPILARNSGAVPATVGSSGILFDDNGPDIMAELVQYIISHSEVKRQLVRNGLLNLEHFRYHNRLKEVEQHIIPIIQNA